MAEEYLFDVPSSDGVTNYLVSIVANQDKLIVTCSCKAGILKKLCKHKIAVLSANMANTGADDPQSLLVKGGVGELLARSSLGGAFRNYVEAETQLAKATSVFDREKRKIESAMRGGI